MNFPLLGEVPPPDLETSLAGDIYKAYGFTVNPDWDQRFIDFVDIDDQASFLKSVITHCTRTLPKGSVSVNVFGLSNAGRLHAHGLVYLPIGKTANFHKTRFCSKINKYAGRKGPSSKYCCIPNKKEMIDLGWEDYLNKNYEETDYEYFYVISDQISDKRYQYNGRIRTSILQFMNE